MRILGIDPGTGITGFGIIDTDNPHDIRFIDAGVIRTKPNTEQSIRLAEIYEGVCELIDEFSPDRMSIEKLFFAQNITTAMTVSEARGVSLLAAERAGIDIYEYTPLQIKQALTGYGKAEKIQVQEMVRTILKLKSIPKPDDAADGLAAAITHAFSVG